MFLKQFNIFKTPPYSFLIQFKTFASFHNKMKEYVLPLPDLDFNYLCNSENTNIIQQNIKDRKGIGDVNKVLELNSKIQELKGRAHRSDEMLLQLQNELISKASKIPNKTHPTVLKNSAKEPIEVESVGKKPKFHFTPRQFNTLAKNLGLLRLEELPPFCGEKSYRLKGSLAMLERALVKYAVDRLLQNGFELVSVPDILHPGVVERCGMPIVGEHNQVYNIKPSLIGSACLSGTAEMALAAYFAEGELPYNELPVRKVAASRCFRAEAGERKEEKALYRVHQFTKVEMFGVTANETGLESEELLNEFVTIQKSLYTDIGLHYKVLDMPSGDLAAAAYRKYDIEAWMPGRGKYGEISSSSNCTDYQSRRLHIKYYNPDNILKYAHTVNGTACAIPRLLISIFGTFQNKDGSVTIPDVLRPYMNGIKQIEKNTEQEIIYYKKDNQRRLVKL